MYAHSLRRVAPEEYLAREVNAVYKSEYYDGVIVPMAGTSVNHNRIVGNIYALHSPLLL